MEHAAELLPYAATIIGALIVYILNGVKTEIKDMGHTIKTLERDHKSLCGPDGRYHKERGNGPS